MQILEDAGLIRTETQKARKGNQKICHSTFDEVLVVFKDDLKPVRSNTIEVSMPIGLYTSCEVTAPCGLCSPEGIIGLLDVPDTFLDPDRMKAGLIWFTRGFVEYQFPNNAKLTNTELDSIEFAMELSSEVPGTSADWPSDITLSVNGHDVGTWTSPGDFGDKRGVYTPDWWKLKGSQYGKLKNWRIGQNGTYVDGMKISDISHFGPRTRRPPLDPSADRRAQRGQASRRHQHLRPRFRQLRPGHRDAPACRALARLTPALPYRQKIPSKPA